MSTVICSEVVDGLDQDQGEDEHDEGAGSKNEKKAGCSEGRLK
jgi:hypothetical protein